LVNEIHEEHVNRNMVTIPKSTKLQRWWWLITVLLLEKWRRERKQQQKNCIREWRTSL
jgi:hypothetical protein